MMHGLMKWATPIAAVAMMIGFSGLMAKADDAPKPAVGSISGVVTDKDGKPAANVTINLLPPPPPKGAGNGNTPPPAPKSAIGDRTLGGKDKGAKAGGKKGGPQPVASTTTGADGSYSFAGVAVGDYIVTAGSKKDATGFASSPVSVKEGANATVPLQLALPKVKAPKTPPAPAN